MTERHSKVDRSASNLGTPLDDMTSCPESPRKEGNNAIATSRSNPPRRRIVAKAPNGGKQFDGGNLRISIFQGVAELVSAKGYKIVTGSPAGIDLLASKPTEVTRGGYIVDILPFKFHRECGLIKISDNGDGSQVLKGENDGINTLSDKLVQDGRSLITAVSEQDGNAEESGDHHIINALVEGLETRSVNLLFGKLNYMRLKGKDVGFWVNPVLLTASQLENESGESKPWIPIPAKLRGLDYDVVDTTHLASYLDLREKEVKTLGRQALRNERKLGDFPAHFRTFRLTTLGAALTLIITLLMLASSIATGFPTAQLGIGLALTIEALGGWRLFRSYRRLQRDRNVKIHTGSRMIAPEHIVMNEVEFTPEELPYLYSKYGGRELSKLKRELRTQRINELVRKTEDLLDKAEKFESEKQYSEAVLSIERATRSALSAALLSVGVEVQARDFDQWIPSLKRILQEDKLEHLRSLRELRDRVSRGYDASRREVEKIKETAKPVIDIAVDRVKNPLKGSDSRNDSSTIESTLDYPQVGVQTKVNRYREQSNDRHRTKDVEESKPRISSEVLNTAQSLKFLLNVADDDELLNLGSAGDYLVKAKKTLETNATDQSKHTELPDADTTRVSEELDDLAKSLTPQRGKPKGVQVSKRDASHSFSYGVTAPKTILPFESLTDFKKAITRCQLPLVTSFLSDDEPSKEVKSAMERLVAKHNTRAAFIAVHSRSEDIARECRIKSYPTILVFRGGKTLGELKLIDVEQLEKDLLELIESVSSDDRDAACQHRIQLTTSGSEKAATTKQIGEQSDGIG